MNVDRQRSINFFMASSFHSNDKDDDDDDD